MLNSPLKTVVDKIKPVKSKSTVSSLKFERSSDFKKLIRFIKDETEELEKIKLPTKSDIEPKSETPFLGLLGIGAFGGLLALFGGDKENKKKARIPSFGGGAKLAIQSRALGGRPQRKGFKFAFRTKNLKKLFKTPFKKLDKESINKLNFLKGVRNTRRVAAIKKLLENKKILELLKRQAKGDPFDISMIEATADFDAQIKKINKKIKNLVQEGKNEDKFFKRITEKVSPSFRTRVNIFKDLVDESKISFKSGVRGKPFLGPGNFMFKEGFDKTAATTLNLSIGDSKSKAPLFLKNIESLTKIDPLLLDPKNIPSIKGFTPRDFLDKKFTQIGKTTKPLRTKVSSFGKSFMKSKKPMFGIKTSIKGVRFLFSSKVSFAAMLAGLLFDAYDVIKNRDDPFTGLYNVFVEYNNTYGAGKGDPTKLRVKVGKRTTATMGFASQDFVDKVNAARDRENQEILKRKNAAIEANKNNQPDIIIPFKTEATGQSLINMSITPPNTQSKILGSKLNKQ